MHTQLYALSLHDALPIWYRRALSGKPSYAVTPMVDSFQPGISSYTGSTSAKASANSGGSAATTPFRSEEHTSELQSQSNLVCRLLLEKKKAHARTSRSPR